MLLLPVLLVLFEPDKFFPFAKICKCVNSFKR